MAQVIEINSKVYKKPIQIKLYLYDTVSEMRKYMISKGEKKKRAKEVAAFFMYKGTYKGKTLQLGSIHFPKKYAKIKYITHEVAHAVRAYILMDTQDMIDYVSGFGGYADEMAAYLTGDLNHLIFKELEKKGWHTAS